MPARVVQPENAILVSGNPIYEEYELEGTMTYAYPGKLVVPGTYTHQCQIADANSPDVIGVLDVMPDKNLKKMYTDSAPYTLGDQVRVIRGDCVVKLRADHAGSITVGTKVEAGDQGNVITSVTALADIGIAEEAFAAAAADDWIVVKLHGV
jgi:hypothetical protein